MLRLSAISIIEGDAFTSNEFKDGTALSHAFELFILCHRSFINKLTLFNYIILFLLIFMGIRYPNIVETALHICIYTVTYVCTHRRSIPRLKVEKNQTPPQKKKFILTPCCKNLSTARSQQVPKWKHRDIVASRFHPSFDSAFVRETAGKTAA